MVEITMVHIYALCCAKMQVCCPVEMCTRVHMEVTGFKMH